MKLDVFPATPDRFEDLEALFGPRGAYGGCWCMWNRQSQREFDEHRGADNRAALRSLIDRGVVPGLLGYRAGEPVGWVSLGPREDFGRIQRSPVTRPVDDMPVWSIVCFVVASAHRQTGVGSGLLAAAVEYAASQGAVAVEGYPVEPRTDRAADIYAWMGLASMFKDAGFEEIARRSETRPLYRKILKTA